MSQATESGDAALELVGAAGVGERLLNELARLSRRLSGVRRSWLHFFPEAHWVAQLAEGEEAEPLMVLGKDESFAASGKRVPVAFFNGVGGFAAGEAEMLGGNGQVGAGG